MENARKKYLIEVTGDGEWSSPVNTRIKATRVTQVFYIMIADCESNTHTRYPDLPKIQFYIEQMNEGSHFSQEETWMLEINLLMLVIFLYFVGFSVWKFVQEVKKDDFVEKPLAFFLMGLLMELQQILVEFIHLFFFWMDGKGFWFLDMLNHVFSMGSQFIFICVFLLLACGWTITYSDLFEREHYLFIGMIGLAVNGFIALMTLLDFGESHKFHDYSGWPGFLLVLV